MPNVPTVNFIKPSERNQEDVDDRYLFDRSGNIASLKSVSNQSKASDKYLTSAACEQRPPAATSRQQKLGVTTIFQERLT
jgi:hypothetical protein